MKKPPVEEITGQHFRGGDAREVIIDIQNVDDDSEPDDDDFEVQLTAAVDYLRRAQNYLGFFWQQNEETDYLGDKSAAHLSALVDEIEDFLGEYK